MNIITHFKHLIGTLNICPRIYLMEGNNVFPEDTSSKNRLPRRLVPKLVAFYERVITSEAKFYITSSKL